MKIRKLKRGGRLTKKYYLDFFFRGVRRQLPAFTTKDESEALSRRVQELIDSNVSGETKQGLESWLNKQPDSMLKTFARWGLVSETRADSTKSILIHLQDYIAVLKSRKHTPDYIRRMQTRCKAIIEDCRFAYFRNIRISTVELYLGKLRKKNSETTVGHYLDAFKTFLNWCVEDGRLQVNPLARLKKEPRQSEKKGVLTPEQFMRLILHTLQNGEKRGQLRGIDRATLYFMAGCTGLRRSELLQLQWTDLYLSAQAPYVHVRADISKNDREMNLPLPAGLAAMLRRMLPKQAGRVFYRFGRHCRTAEQIRKDLKTAGIPLHDADGNEICFHSLRNSYISFMLNKNIPLKVAQKLARHTDPRLTMNVYGRSFPEQEQEAIRALPAPNIMAEFLHTSLHTIEHRDRILLDSIRQPNRDSDRKNAVLVG